MRLFAPPNLAARIPPCALLFALVAPSWAQTGPPVIFAQPTYSVVESAGVVTATVRLADDRLGGNFSVTGTVAALDDVTVAFANEHDRTPTQFNYDMSTQPVTFRLDQTATQAEVTIPIIADSIPESEESIPLQLLSFGHADSTREATVVITDDDMIVVGFQNSNLTLREDLLSDSFCVNVTAPLSTIAIELPDLYLEVNTMPGSADTDDDFVPFTRQSVGPFSLATRRQCSAYEVINDGLFEDDESFTLELTFLSGPREKVVIAPVTATVVITDDDDIVIGFERTSYALDEGDSRSVCVAMTRPAVTASVQQEFMLNVSTRPGTAGINDFTNFGDFFNPPPKILTFGPSTPSACFNFETTEDAIAEDGENMFFDLVARGSLERVTINPAVSSVMIADNDPVTIGFVSTEVAVVEGDDSAATVCVEITGPATIERADFSLSLRTTDGSATVGADYSAPTTPTLGPFGSGDRRECADVVIIDDAVAESSETFRMFAATTGNPVGVIVDPSSLTVTIADDDVFMDYSSDGRLIDVSTVEQLNAMRWDLDGNGMPEQAHATSYTAAFPDAARNMGCNATCEGYALANDIDLGASRFGRGRSSEGWQPIAGLSDGLRGFTSNFDGRGHVITGLYINRPASDRVGLFGHIGQTSPDDQHRVQNLGLLDVDVTGANEVGALAGRISTDTVVTTIYAAGGSVTGDDHVGGLAGWVEDDLIAVYASVAVSGTNGVGGLAGTYYSVGDKELTASYAAGRVTGTTNAGGLVGNRASGDTAATVNDSYWDTRASGQSASALGVGYDTAALQTPTTYSGIYATWNVDVTGDGNADDPWAFGGADNYPVLRGTGTSVLRQLLRSSRIVISVTGTTTVAEGGVATYTVAASRALPYPLTVHWNVGSPAAAQSAATAQDFRADGRATMALSAFPSGTATIRTGNSETTFSVYVFDDEAREDPESFRVGVRVGDFGGRITVAEESAAVITAIEASDGSSVVSARVYLQGAYAGDGRMRTRLIEYLPASSPYGAAPWNAPQSTVPGMSAGDFGLSGVTDTVVDWVLVELRKTPQGGPAPVVADAPLARQAALLLDDGTIVGVDGSNGDALRTEGVLFGVGIDGAREDLYVLIRHRNHVSAMARATAAGCDAGADYCADFRFQPSHQNCQVPLGNGRYAMFAGDTDDDDDVDVADEAAIRAGNLDTIGARHYRAAAGGYAIDADLDFDGEVLSADRRYIILNTSSGTQTLTCAFLNRP